MLYALLAVIVAACGGGDSDGVVGTGFGDPADNAKPFTISGAAQKGPFIKGTRVLINRLTNLAEGTYETTVGEIDDNLGNFRFTYKGIGPVLIEADGVHFNEVTGQLSNSQLRLRAIYNVNNNPEQRAYINVLTHLAYGRIQKLIRSGTPIDDAIRQGEAAVIESLQPVLPMANVVDFTELSLFNTDLSRAVSNAYLLALSATVSQYAIEKQKANLGSPVESELTYLLDNLAYNIADTGRIDNAEVVASLRAAVKRLRPDQIRANLAKRSADVTSAELPVADMNLFIDTDGDGSVNADDGDDDNDGIPDDVDSTPYVSSPTPALSRAKGAMNLLSMEEVSLELATAEEFKAVEMQIADSADFSGVVRLLSASGSIVSTQFEQAGEYFVRSRGRNALGGWSAWSSSESIVVGKLEADISVDYSKVAKSILATKDGGYLILGLNSERNWIRKLDKQGKFVWDYTSSLKSSSYLGDKIAELDDGSFALLDFVRPDVTAWFSAALVPGNVFVTLIDQFGRFRWTRDVGISLSNGSTISPIVGLDDALFIAYTLRVCTYSNGRDCNAVDLGPTLLEIDAATGLPRNSVLVVKGDLPDGATKTQVEGLVVSLKKTETRRLVLTLHSRAREPCAIFSLCYRTGIVQLGKDGVEEWESLADRQSPLYDWGTIFTSKIDGGGFLLTEFVYSGDELKTITRQVDQSGQQIVSFTDVGYRAVSQLEGTRNGQVVGIGEGTLFASDVRFIVRTDIKNKTRERLVIDCANDVACVPVALTGSRDGGLVFLIEQSGAQSGRLYSITKILDADKLPCCQFTVEREGAI